MVHSEGDKIEIMEEEDRECRTRLIDVSAWLGIVTASSLVSSEQTQKRLDLLFLFIYCDAILNATILELDP